MTTVKCGSRGADVVKLQTILGVTADGIFGKVTETAVRNFQAVHNLVVDGIVGKNTWAALENTPFSTYKRSSRNIKEIIIHCADTPEGMDFTVEDIRQWHLARNFSDIGYHYVIYRDGSVHNGRDVDIAGAHCLNHNSISIGICYIGGRAAVGVEAKDTRTPEQKKSMLALLQEMRKLYPTAKIYGHRDFANKLCPCFDAKSEYASV